MTAPAGPITLPATPPFSVRSTATAVSALVMAEQYGDSSLAAAQAEMLDVAYRGDLSELMLASMRRLADCQNPDGGWGETPAAPSDLTSSMLALSVFRLTCVPARYADLEPRLEQYIKARKGAAALRRTIEDRSLLLGVLSTCAAAGVGSWKQTPVVRFERAAAPASIRGLLSSPQFDSTNPVMLAGGLARFRQLRPSNPALRWLRGVSVEPCLQLIAAQQSDAGCFRGQVQTTSFVVAALASAGKASHPIVRRAVTCLLTNVGPDATWLADCLQE
ncbi:Prenyltransferase and squalene oxidase repeat protein [Posidoniimonas polymericola]|uniref:Prenyltransferase and squalene oxidase repeat protein n=2 Tax=Posidoniimonas polymericola TaxID=2528002 RepID=A0A5C5YRV5_9BACT|nr:Prenyltransferase and squalene oxidase repeat protein [Posidoniimonas polymericola]